jgi:hypothetical protein
LDSNAHRSTAGAVAVPESPLVILDLQALPHDPCESDHSDSRRHDVASISVLIGILVVVVVGAICFWAIDKFANDRRLANLLKLLVVLVCLGAIVQRLLVLMY